VQYTKFVREAMHFQINCPSNVEHLYNVQRFPRCVVEAETDGNSGGHVVVNPLTQTCDQCGRTVASGDGLAAENDWVCRPCWEQHYRRLQSEQLLQQLPGMEELTRPMGSPEALDAARREACRLMGKSEDTLPDPVEAGQFPPFVMVTGQGFRSMQEGDGPTARWCFEQGVLMRPLDVEAVYHLATFFDVSHMLDETALWVDRVLALDPHHYNALMMKAMGCERHRDNEGAMELYRRAIDLGGGAQATDRLAQVMADMKVCLEPWPAWRDCHRVLAEDRRWYEEFPAWRENWVHPRDNPPRSFDIQGAFGVWDNVFSEEMLTLLEETAVQHHLFWQTNGLVAPEGSSVTVWYPWTERAPRIAAELAVHLIAPLLGEDPKDYAGIEWWGKSRSGNRGQNLHYDESEGDRPWMRCTTCGRLHAEEWLDGEHNPWRPKYINVLYLSDNGGPSAFMEQVYNERAHHQPIVPQRGFFAMPKRGRLCSLRGDCKHGNMAADHMERELRNVFVFDFWETHRPPPKHCTDVQFERCLGLQKLVMPPEEMERIVAIERARGGPVGSARPVRCEVLHVPDDLPCSTRMGFWNFALPMPSLQHLREGTGFFRLEWRAAVEAYVRGDLKGEATVLPVWPPPGALCPSPPSDKVDCHLDVLLLPELGQVEETPSQDPCLHFLRTGPVQASTPSVLFEVVD